MKDSQLTETTITEDGHEINRRRFLCCFGGAGASMALMPGALAAVAGGTENITAEMVKAAAKIAGLTFSEDEVGQALGALNGLTSSYAALRTLDLGNDTPPAIVFNPLTTGIKPKSELRPATVKKSQIEVLRPEDTDELAFLSVVELSELLRTRKISSTELTKIYLARLKKFDPQLLCVVTLTEELALRQAKQADTEIAAGKYRGPLHGIPWGAKDLFAVRGYRTTWGASPYKDQIIDQDATVYQRLTEAGAVLVAKLSMGSMATGDRWFKGRTRCPWNTEEGANGSSAGPGAATAAGLVAFAIGTETVGSIIGPSHKNGITGLRPTFGRVSRHGAMTVSWTLDKVGPMCRSAEDCALVFAAIHGPDGLDNSVMDVPFGWDGSADVSKLRVGYMKKPPGDLIDVLASLDIKAKRIDKPKFDLPEFSFILATEAAAAHDELCRSGRDLQMLKEPELSRWPNTYRQYRFVPAVEYIQAQRARTQVMHKFEDYLASQNIDVLIGSYLSLTNYTGQPEISIPYGFDQNGMPASAQLTGRLFGDEQILQLAHGIQSKTEHHLEHPELG